MLLANLVSRLVGELIVANFNYQQLMSIYVLSYGVVRYYGMYCLFLDSPD